MPDIPETLAMTAIVSTASVGAVAIVFASIAIAIGFRYNATETASFLRDVLRGGNALRLLFVFMLILALVTLAALNRLSDVVVNMLSALAAFLLGGLRRGFDARRGDEAE